MICDCINIQHPAGRCKREAKKMCERCGDKLCNGCAAKHHAHTENIVDFDA